MATLPNIPVNSVASLGILAGVGLIGFCVHTRAKLDSQNLENYHKAKMIDAGMNPGETQKLTVAQ